MGKPVWIYFDWEQPGIAIRKNKGLAIGNGFIFSLIFAIPFIGGMMAAVVAPVAACIAVIELESRK